MCKVNHLCGEGPKDEVIAESSPAFCECPLPMGFTNHKAQGEGYEEQKHT
jgi:hypothetical protein